VEYAADMTGASAIAESFVIVSSLILFPDYAWENSIFSAC